MLRDLRYSIRTLLRQPGFTAVAVLTLAIGIGANTAIFSTVNAVLLRALPYPEPDELYALRTEMSDGRSTTGAVGPAQLTRLNENARVVRHASGTFRLEAVLLDPESNPVKTVGYGVMSRFFQMFDLPMALGRGFTAEEHAVGGPDVVILAHHIWQNVFGSSPEIIGSSVRFEGNSVVVVGVAPAGFAFPKGADLWVNLSFPPLMTGSFLDGFMRAVPGVSQQEVESELGVIAEGLARDFPGANRGRVFAVQSLLESIVGELGPTLVILLGASGTLLLIACVNVTNLLLARGATRAREIALRVALGAGRGTIIRQLMTESIVLAAAGAAGGLVVAWVGVRFLLALGAESLPRLTEVPIDGTVLLFALATTVVTGIFVGFAPALRLAGTDLKTLVNEGGRGNSGGPAQARLFGSLVGAEIALAVVLVAGAGLLVRSFAKLQDADTGFRADRILTFDLQLAEQSYPDYERVADFYRDIQEQLRGLSGVEAVASATTIPLGGEGDFMLNMKREDEPRPEQGQEVRVRFRQVSPGLFSTLGIQVQEGRAFEQRDRRDVTGVAVVNEEFARQFFPNGSSLRRRIDFLTQQFHEGAAGYRLGRQVTYNVEIVGVVEDTKFRSLKEPPEATLYMPQDQAPFRRQIIAVRATSENTSGLVGLIREELRRIDPQLPLEFTPLTDFVDQALARDRLSMMLLTLFGVAALTLAAVGIYGVIAYSVVQRTGELAIRTALGATPTTIRGIILRQGLMLGLLGVGVGIVTALASGRVIASQLYEVSAFDPLVLAVVPIVMLGITMCATFVPALRATRIEPITILRS